VFDHHGGLGAMITRELAPGQRQYALRFTGDVLWFPGSDESSACSPQRAHIGASVGAGMRQANGPLFGEIRFGHYGPSLSSAVSAVGITF
jgi:hypothetical protein